MSDNPFVHPEQFLVSGARQGIGKQSFYCNQIEMRQNRHRKLKHIKWAWDHLEARAHSALQFLYSIYFRQQWSILSFPYSYSIFIHLYFLNTSFSPPLGTGQCDSCLTSFVWLLLLRLLLLQDLTFLHSKDEGEARCCGGRVLTHAVVWLVYKATAAYKASCPWIESNSSHLYITYTLLRVCTSLYTQIREAAKKKFLH